MFESEEYYLSLSDESLTTRYNFDSEMKETFKVLGQDLSEDLAFMKREIRRRKLNRLHLIQFSDEKAEIEKLNAPIDFILMLLDCKSKEGAIQVLNRVKYLKSIDPFWEENWFE